RRAVPEPEEWHHAKQQSAHNQPRFRELFQGSVRRTTVLTILVCALSLTAHWAFQFWSLQHLRNLPDLSSLTETENGQMVSKMVGLVMLSSIAGNFLAAVLARWLTYRRAITCLCLAYFLSMFATYYVPREHESLWSGLAAI